MTQAFKIVNLDHRLTTSTRSKRIVICSAGGRWCRCRRGHNAPKVFPSPLMLLVVPVLGNSFYPTV